jgi:rRNA maturation endonuclease Nob1
MAKSLSTLEKNILKAKGLSDAQLKALAKAGIASRADFATVGDAATLAQLVPKLSNDVATTVIAWALGTGAPVSGGGTVTVQSADAVYCVYCKTKQPKDYKSGEMCVSCGKQAEPILSCYWCSSSGPGKFCRQCGAEFVATAELDLAVLLKREGLPKDEVPKKLKGMSTSDKDVLWGRIRKTRG